MKKWKIILQASNEEEALEYLEILMKGFKVADKLKKPMDRMFIEDPKKKEKLICKRLN